MNSSRKTLVLSQILFRHFSKTAQARAIAEAPANPQRIQKLKEIQKRFQIDDGTPVYLKGGAGDRILFGGTCILTAIGVGMSLQVMYELAIK